jgi:hypothetical protein
MNSTIDIVNLIENNPISTFNTTKYQSKLIEKLQSKFTNYEQQLFLSSFYCYLKYDKINDFIIDLDDVWKWLGFNKKCNAKVTLEKNFIIDKDYKCLLSRKGEQDFMTDKNILLLSAQEQTFLSENNDDDEIVQNPKKESKSSRGGHNREIIMMNIKTFKKFCLKAGTKKADEIHDYFIKLEETLQEIINDESNELRLQLEEKDTIITEKESEITKKESEIDKIKYEKMKEIEAVIISNFPLNTECVYLGRIDNLSSKNESLIKFGHTNNLGQRALDHRKSYENFIVIHAFKVINKVEIETAIKTHPRISKQLRQININGNNKIEMIAYDVDSFTLDMLISLINNIIHDKTYSVKNFNRLIEENRVLNEENSKINKIIEQYKKETHNYLLEINKLREKIVSQNNIIESINKDNGSIYKTIVVPNEDNHSKCDEIPLIDEQENEEENKEEKLIKRFDEFIDKMCIIDPKLVEHSVNLECRFRLWNNRKPEKEVFHALKNYLDTRFKPKRVNGVHCYCGLKLIELEYKKIQVNSYVETFIFENCCFSDTGKVLETNIIKEYQKWRKSINLNTSDNDMVDMKSYLKENKNVLRAVIWTSNGSNNGYYGISLRKEESDAVNKKLTSSTAKKVEKVDCETGEVIGRWDSVAQTADFHGVCTAKISRYIKNRTIVSNYYFKSC